MNMKTLTETSTFRVLSLLLCFCFFIPAMNVSASSLQADKFKVSGIVKDATGEPVIGASVVEKGTTNGTVTDTWMVISISRWLLILLLSFLL